MPGFDLPDACPTCGKPMKVGFLLAGEEGEAGLYWSAVDPRTEIARPTPIREKPRVRSFRFSAAEPDGIEAHRCEECQTVVFRSSRQQRTEGGPGARKTGG